VNARELISRAVLTAVEWTKQKDTWSELHEFLLDTQRNNRKLADALPKTFPDLYRILGFSVFYNRSKLSEDATNEEREVARKTDAQNNANFISRLRTAIASPDEIQRRTLKMQTASLATGFWGDNQRIEKIEMLRQLLLAEETLSYKQIADTLSTKFGQPITEVAVAIFVNRNRELLGISRLRKVQNHNSNPDITFAGQPEILQQFVEAAHRLYYEVNLGRRNSHPQIVQALNKQFGAYGLNLTVRSWETWKLKNARLIPVDPTYQPAIIAQRETEGVSLDDQERLLVENMLAMGYTFEQVFALLMSEDQKLEFQSQEITKRSGSEIKWANWKALWSYVDNNLDLFPLYQRLREQQEASEIELMKQLTPLLSEIIEAAVVSGKFEISEELVRFLAENNISGAKAITRINKLIVDRAMASNFQIPTRKVFDRLIRLFQES
jgi:hypothetical protein